MATWIVGALSAYATQIGVDQEPRDDGGVIGVDAGLLETGGDKGQESRLLHGDEFLWRLIHDGSLASAVPPGNASSLADSPCLPLYLPADPRHRLISLYRLTHPLA